MAVNRGALEELTPQQRQIVRLASAGLTNREIADRLFLSPRTVSSHLYRTYPKLGVGQPKPAARRDRPRQHASASTRRHRSGAASLGRSLHRTATRVLGPCASASR